MNYKVFTDFHHAGLLNSLILLFEKRLGGEVYRPIGKDWFEKGYWKVYDHPATVEQFLGIGGNTPDGSPPLNEVIEKGGPHTFKCQDIDSGYFNRAITLDGFMSLPFDIVIASIPHHIEPFKRLCSEHPNKPKLIYQIGNAWTIEAGLAKNIMASAVIDDIPPDINFISYHQEFDLDVFKPRDMQFTQIPDKKIYSFVNCFSIQEHFKEDWSLFTSVERFMHDYEFKSFGGSCRDGACHGSKQVSDKMNEARFIWHTKAGGDGYGHVVFNTAAIGRPMITRKSYYKNKLGDKLMIDGETCINIDNLTMSDIAYKINYYSDPDRYRLMCTNVYNNFKKQVDFDMEEKRLREFLLKLL